MCNLERFRAGDDFARRELEQLLAEHFDDDLTLAACLHAIEHNAITADDLPRFVASFSRKRPLQT